MKFLKAMWQFGLCALFAIGLSYGFSAHATEAGESEEASHKIQETQGAATQELEEMKGEAQEEAQELKGEAQEEIQETQEDVKEEMH
jgi:F0F1-type ATP synthase membrane subunit b/b'